MRVLISGGGTAGYINPGLAIAKFIMQKDPLSEILFIGTEEGLEKSLVPRDGFNLSTIKVRGFKRKLSFEFLIAIKELFQGYWQARMILKRFKPDIVIGTGGYVCGPVVLNAVRMKIPTLIHEQNAFPGITNRILSRFVDAVAISFKESKEYFKVSKKLIHTGNPVRTELLGIEKSVARQTLALNNERPLVVVVGGSRGAGNINETIINVIRRFYKNSDCEIIFSTGEQQFDTIINQLGTNLPSSIKVLPYIFDARNIYAAADLVICRAGAITVSELEILGIPSIMIPSPNVTPNHQEYNARALEKEGGTVVILEKELTAELLYLQMMNLLKDKEQLNKMSRNAKKIGITNANEKIYSIIMEIKK